jgi:superfamily I DNA and/or RNA helicase
MALPFCLEKIQKIFVVGDSAQLPPFGSKTNYDVESVFTAIERAYVDVPSKVKFLETQFRMPSIIAAELSIVSYKGRLRTAKNKEPKPRQCLFWLDVNGKESAGRADGSKTNVEEVELIVNLVKWLRDGPQRDDIAVLAFYAAQQSLLTRAFNQPHAPKNVNVYRGRL